MLRIADARNFSRTLAGLLLFAAPAVLLISSIIQPSTDHANKLEELRAVAAHKGIYLASSVLYLVGGLLVIAMGIGVMRVFRGARGITLGQLSGGLLALGGAASVGFYAVGVTEYEMVNYSGLNRQALATYLHKAEHASALLPIVLLFIVGVVLGTILLAIANWRTKLGPGWASIAIAVGGAVGAFAQARVPSIAANVVLLAGLSALGARVLARPEEEWDPPHERAGQAVAMEPEPAPAATV